MIFFDNWRQKIHKFQQGETPVSMSKVSISTAPTTQMSPDTHGAAAWPDHRRGRGGLPGDQQLAGGDSSGI